MAPLSPINYSCPSNGVRGSGTLEHRPVVVVFLALAVVELDDSLDLHGNVHRQGVRAHGTPRVDPPLPKDLNTASRDNVTRQSGQRREKQERSSHIFVENHGKTTRSLGYPRHAARICGDPGSTCVCVGLRVITRSRAARNATCLPLSLIEQFSLQIVRKRKGGTTQTAL